MAKALTPSAPASGADQISDHPTTPSEKRAAQVLLWALKPFLNLRGSIPLPFVTTFLMVVLDEGRGVNAYARAAGIHRAAMSRYLQDIGDRARNGGAGLGLVTIEDHPTDTLKSRVFLTAKGRSIAQEVFQQLRKVRERDE